MKLIAIAHHHSLMTGYIGGDVFHEIVNAHPNFNYVCLVRNSDKGAQIASVFPKTKLVYGELDDVELLEKEAGEADIVISQLTSNFSS